jgi:hypothetical protein
LGQLHSAQRFERPRGAAQTIWRLAKGHSVDEVVEMTSFGLRWIEHLAARYNAERPESLGDLRRRNGSAASVLKTDASKNSAKV